MMLAILLADAACSVPAAGCKQEVVTGVKVIVWMLAAVAGLSASWKVLNPFFSAGDGAGNMADAITRANRMFKFYRRLIPILVTLLLLTLILGIVLDRVSAWAG